MEVPAQQMRRRGTLFSAVFPFKRALKSPAKTHLNPLFTLPSSSNESLNFDPSFVLVKILEASLICTKDKYENMNVFAKVSIGKEKHETRPINKGENMLSWKDEPILLEIPEHGNTAAITVGIYLRKRLADECLGITAIFLRDFQPSHKERFMVCNLQSKSDSRITGEVTISVTFKATSDSPPEHPPECPYGGSCKSLNVFQRQALEGGKLRRNSSFNTNTDFPLCSKPLQYVKPVVKVTDSNDSDSDEDKVLVRSARGRVNSLFELEGVGAERPSIHKVSESSEGVQDASAKFEHDVEQLPEEFRGKSRIALVEIILSLREVIQEQDEKLLEMQEYIDNRLASILEANPSLLDATPNTLVNPS